jgi:hypothetical protein
MLMIKGRLPQLVNLYVGLLLEVPSSPMDIKNFGNGDLWGEWFHVENCRGECFYTHRGIYGGVYICFITPVRVLLYISLQIVKE